ncbi:tripartite tricarboxylate transporter substrate binding protein [Alcaligenaceae bacterium]|nr:tripartite tricarboxylate transporter substrate binding protein [Alcaligenaceae bacterium]
MKMHKFFAIAALSVGSVLVAPFAAAADSYPNQPIKLIVPFPPGGGTDTIARFLANELSESYSWNVVVENRPGAGGTIGLGMLARSSPDGYTMAVGQTSNLSINPYLYKDISYKVQDDFAPVVSLEAQPMVLLTSAKRNFRSVADLIAYAKDNPGTLAVGNAGTGTVGDITGRYFAQEADIDLLHVPYKGAAPAMNDLLGGQIDIIFAATPAAMAQRNSDKINVLAVTTLEPVPQLPGVPLLTETLPGFEAASKSGIVVPAGTPEGIIDILNERINEALSSANMIEKLQGAGSVIMGGTVEKFAQEVVEDSSKWSAIIKAADIRID